MRLPTGPDPLPRGASLALRLAAAPDHRRVPAVLLAKLAGSSAADRSYALRDFDPGLRQRILDELPEPGLDGEALVRAQTGLVVRMLGPSGLAYIDSRLPPRREGATE
jgi:hypothetical protein